MNGKKIALIHKIV